MSPAEPVIVWNTRDPLGGRTPAEFEALTSDPSPGFWTSAVANLRRVV